MLCLELGHQQPRGRRARTPPRPRPSPAVAPSVGSEDDCEGEQAGRRNPRAAKVPRRLTAFTSKAAFYHLESRLESSPVAGHPVPRAGGTRSTLNLSQQVGLVGLV